MGIPTSSMAGRPRGDPYDFPGRGNFYKLRITSRISASPQIRMRLRRTRLRIVLQPGTTRHKFRLCTEFTVAILCD